MSCKLIDALKRTVSAVGSVCLMHFIMISCTRTNYSYMVIVLLQGPFTACTNSGVHVLSFTVLKEIKLKSVEPLHWLIL